MKTVVNENGEKFVCEKAGLMPVSMYDKIWNSDQKVCLSMKLTEDALSKSFWQDRIYRSKNNRTCFALSSSSKVGEPEPASFEPQILYAFGEGYLDYISSRVPNAALRVVTFMVYDSKSDLVKNVKVADAEAEMVDGDTRRVVRGLKNLVSINGRDYVWLNRKECESKKSMVMVLTNDKADTRAIPFCDGMPQPYGKNPHNKYDMAVGLRQQAEDYVLQDLPPELHAMVITMKRSESDKFETFKPALNPGLQLMVVQAYNNYINSNRNERDFQQLEKIVEGARYIANATSYKTETDRSIASDVLEEVISNKEKHLDAILRKESVESRTTGYKAYVENVQKPQNAESETRLISGRRGMQRNNGKSEGK